MNKKFLTVAIAAALIAPTAVLADVTVYGKLHMSLDYSDTNSDVPAGTTNANKGNLGVSSNSSRLGFKGSEDLGGGLKAVWQIEQGVSLDEGSGNFATRNSYLGLAGGFGTFLMGRHDTPFKMLGRKFDPFGDTIADNRTMFMQNGSWDMRPSNVLAYVTPDFSGFQSVIAYVTGVGASAYDSDGDGKNEGGADNNKITAFSINGTYSNGPLFLGAAYESHNFKNDTANTVGNGAAVAGADNPTAFRLGGSYSFGPAKVGAMWQTVKNSDVTKAADTSRDAWTLFGTYGFGNETVKLAYTQAGEQDVGGATGTNSDASLLAIGIDHKLSKRTKAYAQYTSLSNEAAAQFALGASGYGDAVTPATGKDPSAFSVGLIHKF